MSADKLINKNIKELMDTMITKMEVVNPKKIRSYSNDSLNSLDSLDNVSFSDFLPNSDDANLIVRLPPSPNSVKEKRMKEEAKEREKKREKEKK